MKIPFFSKNKKVKGKQQESNRKSTKAATGKKPKVIVYSTKTCPWCQKTKEFLKENKIPFTNRDVGTNQKYAADMIKKSHQSGVPVIDVNGEIIVGFNGGNKLKKALNL